MFVFFFQAEDGIRDKLVTGVQTCALPISLAPIEERFGERVVPIEAWPAPGRGSESMGRDSGLLSGLGWRGSLRSEEHTSELQSLAYLVCRLLLEKKKKTSILLGRYAVHGF